MGSLTIGFAWTTPSPRDLSTIVDADVCFAPPTCLAASPGARDATLAAKMIGVPRASGPTYVTHDGRRLALVATPLPTDAPVAR